jgi:hypothetical protein
MRRLCHVLAVGAIVLGVCAAAVPAGADRANDQQIADNAVLTSDDVPGFEPNTNEDAPLPNVPECRGLERARKQLEAAPNKEVDFRTPSEAQDVNNQVSVLSSSKRARRVLKEYKSPKAPDCFTTVYSTGITSKTQGVDVTVGVAPAPVESGDESLGYDLTVTATKGSESQTLHLTLALVRVGRAVAAYGFGDKGGPVPADVATGLIELVTERLQEAL